MNRCRNACAIVSLLLVASPVAAAPKVTVEKTYYDIAGKSGAELLRSMDRKGPRHGFFGRAIAQTRYEIRWNGEVVRDGGVCRLSDPTVELDITYRYPRMPETARGALRGRWKTFLGAVIKHEEHHGRIAREMASETERMLKKQRPVKASSCSNIGRDLRGRFEVIRAKHEKRQQDFDRIEHSEGGHVDAMIRALLKN